VTALVVVYDANVLYAAPLRDVLMHLALTSLVEARWTHLIQAEWLRNVLKNRVDLERSKLERTQELMNAAVPNALVYGFEHLIQTLQLPDSDDRHVLAAAIQTRATIITTKNLSDFPRASLESFGIEALHPDDFICRLLDINSAVVISALGLQRRSMKYPPLTVDEFLQMLEKQDLHGTVKRLRLFAVLL
jgi:predicted nucleic acid-binding protein